MTEPFTATGDPLERIVQLYRQIAELDRTPGSSWRKRNQLSDELFTLLPRVFTDPMRFARLQAVAAGDADPLVRELADANADPMPTSGGVNMDAWLAHPAAGLAELVGAARPAMALEEITDDPEALAVALELCYDEHYDASWLGGPPLGPLPGWPRRDDGLALVHVAQIDLRRLATVRANTDLPRSWQAGATLPDRGVVQIFHDLESGGGDAADGRRGAWLVRWVGEPTAAEAVPDDATGPTAVNSLVGQNPTATLPPVEDVPAHLAEATIIAAGKLLASNALLGRHLSPAELAVLKPVSLLLGHGWESEVEARRILSDVTDVDGDGWTLLVDLVGVGALDTWFGDEGHLQMWVPTADLAEHRFDRAWALLR
jgi:hypothetical protein